MIKKDIAEELYQTHGGMTRNESEGFTQDLIDLLGQALVREETVTITHFGKFYHKQRPVREVIMPNGKQQLTNAGTRICFQASPALKTFLNTSEE